MCKSQEFKNVLLLNWAIGQELDISHFISSPEQVMQVALT